MKRSVLNVYFYALFEDATKTAHSGVVTDFCESALREDIYANYVRPRYITIRRIPELLAVIDDDTGEAKIMPRREALRASSWTTEYT